MSGVLIAVEEDFENSDRGKLNRNVSGTLGVNIRPFFAVKYFMAELGSTLSRPQQSASMKVKASVWGSMCCVNAPEMATSQNSSLIACITVHRKDFDQNIPNQDQEHTWRARQIIKTM